jgi:predicted nucleic acid-binding Zn ribbon protein
VAVTDNRPVARGEAERQGVTDNGRGARDAADKRNTLAELEAQAEKTLGIKPATPEEREQHRRQMEAARTGRICGECGGKIGEGDTVYRLRIPRPSSFGGTRNTMETLCERCARGEAGMLAKYGKSIRRVLHWGRVRDTTGSEEEAFRTAFGRTLVYSPCPMCERKVVIDESKREREGRRAHILCSEECRRQFRNASRRTKPHSSECVVCGAEFVSKRSDQKTCSDACRQKAYRERRKAADKDTTKVINIKSGEPYDVYIGHRMKRGRYNLEDSPWRNPHNRKYREGLITAHESVGLFLHDLLMGRLDDPNQIAKLPEVRGKILACWCKPGPCHGDVLARLAEALGVDPAELVEN